MRISEKIKDGVCVCIANFRFFCVVNSFVIVSTTDVKINNASVLFYIH